VAIFLYRLGRASYRHRRLVLVLWLGALVLFGVGAGALKGQTSDAFSIPGIESQKAIDLLNAKFPQASAGGASARVVFQAPAGTKLTDPSARAAIESTVATLQHAPQVRSATDPFQTRMLSPDGTVGFAQVQYGKQASELKSADRTALENAPQAARDAGLKVVIGGNALSDKPGGDSSEAVSLAIALVVLLITFGSMIAAGLPLLTAVIGVGLGILGVTAATGLWTMSSTTPTLALMLGLAVGIDYALFIVSRYRHELTEGRTPQEAAARATGTAGSAVVFAGLTVVIALVGLSVVGIPFLTQMGLAAAATVAVAVVIALTLLPALLGFAGTKVLGGKIPFLRGRGLARPDGRPAAGRRWAAFVTRHRIPVAIVAMVAIAALALPVLSMRLALPDDSTAAPHTGQRQAYDLVAKGFGPGFNGPLLVALDAPHGGVKAAADRVGAEIKGLPDVAAVAPARINAAGDTAVINVVPKSAPSSQQTHDLVNAIRSTAPGVQAQTGAEVMVTGTTAVNIDVSSKLSAALPVYLLVVVGLAFLLLMVVFRSLLVPLKAVLGFLFTIGASLGAVVAVFQWGWLGGIFKVDQTAPIMSMTPILLVGILFGLAMDYEVFLVSRMREEYAHGARPSDAIVNGFGHGARVVTAAAAIMISVFSGFVFGDNVIIRSIGLGLAFGVLIDAFVVRMTIVPAVMAIAGRAAWWFPSRLERIVPDVDVEGENLLSALGQQEPKTRLKPAEDLL
jgi:RND superfamily putative drug exporter